MKHIQKFNEEFFFPADAERPRKFDNAETGAYRALTKLRSNLDKAIDLLDQQIASKEAHPEVLKDVIKNTEEYNRFLLSIIQ